jgi:predicted TIM-barrel enzyme
VGQALQYADGVIVSTAFKSVDGWTRESLAVDWDEARMTKFMEAVLKFGV